MPEGLSLPNAQPPSLVSVPASGAAQTLSFVDPRETDYAITLTATCTLTVNPAGAQPGQTILVTLKGAYAYSFPNAALYTYALGGVPVPQCSATVSDVLLITMQADGTVLIAPYAMAVQPAPSQAPTGVTGGLSAGNNLVVTTMSAVANGVAISSFTIMRATVTGGVAGSYASVGTATPRTAPTTGTTTATYTDTSAVNGTAYDYQFVANSSAGSATSATVGPATPTATPAHYLVGTASSDTYTPNPTTKEITDGYIDIQVEVSLPNFTTAATLFAKWASSGTNGSGNSEYIFQINASGQLFLAWFASAGSGGAFGSATSSAAVGTVTGITPNKVIGLRVQANLGTATSNGLPPGTAVFSVSTDFNTWTAVGATQTGLAQNGIAQAGAAATPAFGTLNSSNACVGSLYKAKVLNSSAGVLYWPDLTILASGQTGNYQDQADVPNTWTINGTIN